MINKLWRIEKVNWEGGVEGLWWDFNQEIDEEKEMTDKGGRRRKEKQLLTSRYQYYICRPRENPLFIQQKQITEIQSPVSQKLSKNDPPGRDLLN